MSMFNLVIADADQWYLESLSRYLRSMCPVKLHLNIFTQTKALSDYLKRDNIKIDVLLAAPEMLAGKLSLRKAGSTALLYPGEITGSPMAHPCINKYLPADAILNSLLELYASSSPEFHNLPRADKKASVITLFSPQGGSGKTVISLCLSRHFAGMGLNVLYLNLESINSTASLINGPVEKAGGFSRLLYYLKGNSKNIPLQINNLVCRDPYLNINYFTPANSSLELDELTAEDAEKLLLLLKGCPQFDIVVVDMDSNLSARNLSLLELSDQILMGLVQDPMAQSRLDMFERDVKGIFPEENGRILDKIEPFINKYISPQIDSPLFFRDAAIDYRVPYDHDIFLYHNGSFTLNPNGSSSPYIEKLVQRILSKAALPVKEVSKCTLTS